jgi:hypothetical protein
VTLPDSAPCPDPSAAALHEVRQIYRQLCLLRIGGDRGPARQHVEQELAEALTKLPSAGDVALVLREIYAAEEERVTEAFVLARLLAPMLANQMVPPTAAAPTSGRLRPLAEIVPLGRASHRPAASPSVADFIDEMLAAEPPGRPGR